MKDQDAHHYSWVRQYEAEIEQIRAEIDRLDDQGRTDFRLSQRLDELQRQVEAAKAFLQNV